MAIGLDEVIAAETVLSEVDGNRGKLIIRGRSLDDLAARETYEGVMAMLFEQFLDEPAPPQHWQSALGAARVAVFQHLGSADAACSRWNPSTRCARWSPGSRTAMTRSPRCIWWPRRRSSPPA